MYLLINKTKKITVKHVGSFPINSLEEWLNAGDQVIVVSTYSNTIKVPYSVYSNGETEWEWEDYPFDVKRLQAESKPKPITVTIDGEHTTVTVNHNGVDTIIFQGPANLDLTSEDIDALYDQYVRSTDPTACWDGE